MSEIGGLGGVDQRGVEFGLNASGLQELAVEAGGFGGSVAKHGGEDTVDAILREGNAEIDWVEGFSLLLRLVSEGERDVQLVGGGRVCLGAEVALLLVSVVVASVLLPKGLAEVVLGFGFVVVHCCFDTGVKIGSRRHLSLEKLWIFGIKC